MEDLVNEYEDKSTPEKEDEFIEIFKKIFSSKKRFQDSIVPYMIDYYKVIYKDRDDETVHKAFIMDVDEVIELLTDIYRKEISDKEKFKEFSLIMNPIVKNAFVYAYKEVLKNKKRGRKSK